MAEVHKSLIRWVSEDQHRRITCVTEHVRAIPMGVSERVRNYDKLIQVFTVTLSHKTNQVAQVIIILPATIDELQRVETTAIEAADKRIAEYETRMREYRERGSMHTCELCKTQFPMGEDCCPNCKLA